MILIMWKSVNKKSKYVKWENIKKHTNFIVFKYEVCLVLLFSKMYVWREGGGGC